MRISDNDILRHVGARAMEAGHVYRRQGRVVGFDERPPEITAQVRGSSPTPYQVKIKVTAADRQGVRIEGACSCPVGAYCKHIAAALIESGARYPDDPATPREQPNAAKMGPDAQADESLPPQISQWIAALERSQSPDSENYPSDAQNRLIYVLSLPEYRHAPSQILVEAVSARVLKNGGFSSSVAKPELSTLLSDTPPRYIRPSDVKIVRLLSVARGTAYGGPIRLKEEVGSEIIEAVIATGRARLDNVLGVPLTLGPNRAGKIAWRLGDDSHLRPAIEVGPGLASFLATPSGYLDRAAASSGGWISASSRRSPLRFSVRRRCRRAWSQASRS